MQSRQEKRKAAGLCFGQRGVIERHDSKDLCAQAIFFCDIVFESRLTGGTLIVSSKWQIKIDYPRGVARNVIHIHYASIDEQSLLTEPKRMLAP